MIFAAGYQYMDGPALFSDIAADYRDRIGEVYFAVPGIASGRADAPGGPEKREQLEYELGRLRSMGIALDLLLNGNCYGEWAVSERFKREILALMEDLERRDLMPEIVTTTTPFAAYVIKKHLPQIEVRASVNMRLDSIAALEYLGDGFDSFYIRRDLQRDPDTVKTFSAWCHANGKKLCMLANSGCLRNCPYQTFHDNMVAHDSDLREIRNDKDFLPHLCWKRYQNRENWRDFLRSSWIRPEDIHRYAPYVDVVKLATRQHIMPRMVIAAYTSGSFNGNLLNLTEPCFAGHFQPYVLDNKALDQVELPAACAANCTRCGKCDAILERALIKCAE